MRAKIFTIIIALFGVLATVVVATLSVVVSNTSRAATEYFWIWQIILDDCPGDENIVVTGATESEVSVNNLGNNSIMFYGSGSSYSYTITLLNGWKFGYAINSNGDFVAGYGEYQTGEIYELLTPTQYTQSDARLSNSAEEVPVIRFHVYYDPLTSSCECPCLGCS